MDYLLKPIAEALKKQFDNRHYRITDVTNSTSTFLTAQKVSLAIGHYSMNDHGTIERELKQKMDVNSVYFYVGLNAGLLELDVICNRPVVIDKELRINGKELKYIDNSDIDRLRRLTETTLNELCKIEGLKDELIQEQLNGIKAMSTKEKILYLEYFRNKLIDSTT